MSDYISREAAMRTLCDACGNAACPKGLIPKCSYGERMLSIPAADVRPVVTCIECKHSCDMPGGLRCCYGTCVDCYVEPEFFCADGEREES